MAIDWDADTSASRPKSAADSRAMGLGFIVESTTYRRKALKDLCLRRWAVAQSIKKPLLLGFAPLVLCDHGFGSFRMDPAMGQARLMAMKWRRTRLHAPNPHRRSS